MSREPRWIRVPSDQGGWAYRMSEDAPDEYRVSGGTAITNHKIDPEAWERLEKDGSVLPARKLAVPSEVHKAVTRAYTNILKTAADYYEEPSPPSVQGAAEAIRHDQGKPRYDLIAPEFLKAIATVLGNAAAAGKYAPRNWEKGMDWGRVYRPIISHLNEFWRGVEADPDGNHSHHLWHAAANLMMLLTYVERGIGKDDRK